MKKHQVLLLLCVISFTSFSQSNVSVLYDGTHDFTSQSTFDFSKATKRKVEKQFSGQPYFLTALKTKLNEQGFIQTDEAVDLIVDINLAIEKSLELNKQQNTVHLRYRSKPKARNQYIGQLSSIPKITEEKKARLIINIIDQKKKLTVWTGIWTGEPNPDIKPKKRKKKIDKVLKKMFKSFPKD